MRQKIAFRPSYEELEMRVRFLEKQLSALKSEEKYSNILDSIEEGYYEVDLAGNFTFFNESLRKTFGYSYEELLGMNNREYTSSESIRRIFAIYHQIYRTGSPAKIIDYEVIKKDGSAIMVEVSASLLRDPSGDPVGFYGIVRDRTELKKAEGALRQSEEKYRHILENMEEGYYEVDLAGNRT